MISRKTLRIAGAAILGTLVGTGSAHAQVYLDDDDMTMGQVKVALESLTTKTTVEGEDYYSIVPYGDIFDVQHVVGLRTVPATETIFLDYTLENMVFVTAVTAANLRLTQSDRATATGGTLETIVVTGGGVGDSEVSFSVSPGTAITETADVYAELTIGTLGVSLSATGSVGNVTMQARRYLGGRNYPQTATTLAVVDVDPVLKEAATATPAMATVAQDYMKFSGGTDGSNTKSIGTLLLNVEENYSSVIGGSGFNTATLASGGGGDIVQAGESRVTFTGEVGFVKDVFVSESSACGQLGTPVSLVEDTDTGEAVNMEWKTGDDRAVVNTFAANADGDPHHICIEVDGETEIPVTENYTALAVYAGLEDAPHPPVGETHNLGGITRDGTVVNLPALTTSSAYNQRLVIWNRGSSAAAYSLTFTAEGATAGADASGMLEPGVTNLSLRYGDVVDLGSGTRTAATLNVAAAKSIIDVFTIQVNTADGSTDTVRYEAVE